MYKKELLMALLFFLALTAIPQVARAAIITSCTLDKSTYRQGEAGYIAVMIYNDKDNKIRVTELSATINYYYNDGVMFLQKFFTDAVLPNDIPVGQSATYYIHISLPNNIAPGFTSPTVEAKTELWSAGSGRWITSDRPTYQPRLFIESPYKQLYQEQLYANGYLTNMMNLFVVTTVAFALVGVFFFVFFTRRIRPIAQP